MKKTVVVLLHIGYWLLYLFLLLLFFGMVAPQMQSNGLDVSLPGALWSWSTIMLCFAILPGVIGFYAFYGLLFSRLLRRKKIGLFFVAAFGVGLFGSVVGMIALWLRSDMQLFRNAEGGEIQAMLLLMTFVTLVNGVIGLVMNGFITWYGDIKLKEELGRKNFETELALVKAQLNPHFLFNTINNIDVLILKDPEKASAYLNQLSDMLRFMLYETKTESISLLRELEYMEKYIALQRIRTSNPNYIRFGITGDPGNRTIPPMLFTPFLENAFKYAENKKVENAIAIAVDIAAGTLTFSCSNHYAPLLQQTPDADRNGGLGMELIRKRLELLYPEKHELTITNDGHVYSVQLVLRNHEN